MKRSPTRARAFTLIELMVVATLLAIAVASVALHAGDITTRGRLRAAAGQLANVHRLARIEAIGSGRPRRLVFGAARIVLQEPVLDSRRWQWSDGRFLVLPRRVQIQLLSETKGSTSITVRGDGNSPDYTCVLTLDEARMAVAVEGLTGGISLLPEADPQVGEVR